MRDHPVAQTLFGHPTRRPSTRFDVPAFGSGSARRQSVACDSSRPHVCICIATIIRDAYAVTLSLASGLKPQASEHRCLFFFTPQSLLINCTRPMFLERQRAAHNAALILQLGRFTHPHFSAVRNPTPARFHALTYLVHFTAQHPLQCDIHCCSLLPTARCCSGGYFQRQSFTAHK